jgi:hypothetical protein
MAAVPPKYVVHHAGAFKYEPMLIKGEPFKKFTVISN